MPIRFLCNFALVVSLLAAGVIPAHAGSLAGAAGQTGQNYNISTYGTLDWAHFGDGGVPGRVTRVSSPGLGTAYTLIGSGSVVAATDGRRAVQWTGDGVKLSSFTSLANYQRVVPDGAGGAIVVWVDDRYTSPSPSDIFSRRVNAAGSPQWSANGVSIVTAPHNQINPAVISNGNGGAVVAWQDSRSGTSDDIYALPVDGQGTVATGVGATPSAAALVRTTNYPNPFSSETTIDVSVASDANVNIDVFDVSGRSVRTMDLGRVSAGSRQMTFDGLGNDGRPLASGIYFYRVNAAGQAATRKIVITR